MSHKNGGVTVVTHASHAILLAGIGHFHALVGFQRNEPRWDLKGSTHGFCELLEGPGCVVLTLSGEGPPGPGLILAAASVALSARIASVSCN